MRAIWATAIIAPLASAQQSSSALAFTEPAANALTALGLSTAYESGSTVTIAWTTPFEGTTLLVFQGPLDDGSYESETIAESLPSSETSTTWTASVIDGASNASALHFQLQNADDPTCDGCSADSLEFHIREQVVSSTTSNPTASSTTSSMTSSASTSAAATITTSNSATATSATATSATSTQNVAVGAAATSSSATSSAELVSDSHTDHSHHALDLGLGIGLGLGIPLLLALLGLCIFFALRRRKKARLSQLPRGQRPQSMTRSMAQVSERASDSPLVPSAVPVVAQKRDSSATPRPISSYAPSRYSTAGSRASSYFEPFEFERPGSQDFDTRSVMSAMSGARAASGRGLQRINEDEMPTTPQWPLPAHKL
ncbi:hypothetical protein Tdes44962_MAKER00057 [Teratosphaeria destructans]|uniref:Mid2 domain-containing protein n=1 Tax=Teratosphaeria destructans TaxID=418781 RepID=A0A9W7T1M7_9PEZI|nr:hypothetical protein Tdes44962_MAKER00057 [Teratosphaeria destructans]